jgi:hypothetical protein
MFQNWESLVIAFSFDDLKILMQNFSLAWNISNFVNFSYLIGNVTQLMGNKLAAVLRHY